MTAPFQRDYTADIAALPKTNCSWKKIILFAILIGLSLALLLAFFL
jgi:hypothetical protein